MIESLSSDCGSTNLYLETRVVIEGDPLGAEEGVRTGEVLVSLQSPVPYGEDPADLLVGEGLGEASAGRAGQVHGV